MPFAADYYTRPCISDTLPIFSSNVHLITTMEMIMTMADYCGGNKTNERCARRTKSTALLSIPRAANATTPWAVKNVPLYFCPYLH